MNSTIKTLSLIDVLESWQKKWLIVENKTKKKIHTESHFISDCFPTGLICTFHIWLRIKKKVFTISWLGIRLLGRLPVNMSAVDIFGWGLLKRIVRIVSNWLESVREREAQTKRLECEKRESITQQMKCMVFFLSFFIYLCSSFCIYRLSLFLNVNLDSRTLGQRVKIWLPQWERCCGYECIIDAKSFIYLNVRTASWTGLASEGKYILSRFCKV